MPVGYTILLLSAETKQENQCNEASRFKEKCLRKAQRYQSSLNEEKSLCKLNSLTFAAKKPKSLCEIWIKKGMGQKRESVTTFIMQKYNTQGRGLCEVDGKRGGRLLYTVFT